MGTNEPETKNTPATGANTYELTGLQRGTVYQIYMRSVGDKSALSEPSDMITVRTEGESKRPWSSRIAIFQSIYS